MRRTFLFCAVFTAVAAANPAFGDGTTTTTLPAVTSTDPTVTTADTPTTTSTAAATTETTTTDDTTTAAATAPSATSTVTTPPPTTSSQAGPTRLAVHELQRGCTFGAVALLRPGRMPLVLGPLADGSGAHALAVGRLAYPQAGTLVRATGVSLDVSGCDRGRMTTGSLSLFGGAITARGMTLTVGPGRTPRARITALAVEGTGVPPSRRGATSVGGWGSLRTDVGGRLPSALRVSLLEPHAGLPAGTIVLVFFAALPEARSQGTKRPGLHRPLKVTPALGLHRYVFPVAGPSAFADTYGAFRSDVRGHWHHGDDIFAPLGTPVVAVADGTLNRVGWEAVGGWRLWVRDGVGNEFYYAHLSGYTVAALHSRRVKAGEVLGFIGDTGDAFPTTPPHLHFEIHPRPLLHLAYDGAVDPTSYLRHWPHADHVVAPRPVHPLLPIGAVRHEAREVFRELLAARHLLPHPSAHNESASPSPFGSGGDRRALPSVRTAAATRTLSRSPLLVALLYAMGALALLAASAALTGYRSRRARGPNAR